MRHFLTSLIECSVSMSALALGFMVLTSRLSRRYGAKWLYYAWLVIVIGLIIPFRFHPDAALVQVSAVPFIQQLIPQNIENFAAPAVQTGSAGRVLPAIPWHQFVGFLWIAGVFAFVFYHGLKHYRFLRLVNRWGEQANDPQILEVLQKIKKDMGIAGQVKLQVCSCISSPMMIGFLNPAILLPRSDFSADELPLILRHELTHLKRRDLWYKSLVFFAAAIHWFNPVIYLMAKAIALQCEISCDAEVVSGTGVNGRQRYSEIIVGVIKDQAKIQTAFSTNFYGGKKGMEKRIFSIMDTTKKKAGVIVLCLILIGTATTGVVFTLDKNAEADPGNGLYGTEVEDFLNSTDGHNFRNTADKFVNAYLVGDIETMKSCLSDPESDKNDFSMEGKSVDYTSLTLKLSAENIEEDMVTAEYEIAPAGQDSFDYLYLKMKRVIGEWKVEFYGLEK